MKWNMKFIDQWSSKNMERWEVTFFFPLGHTTHNLFGHLIKEAYMLGGFWQMRPREVPAAWMPSVLLNNIYVTKWTRFRNCVLYNFGGLLIDYSYSRWHSIAAKQADMPQELMMICPRTLVGYVEAYHWVVCALCGTEHLVILLSSDNMYVPSKA